MDGASEPNAGKARRLKKAMKKVLTMRICMMKVTMTVIMGVGQSIGKILTNMDGYKDGEGEQVGICWPTGDQKIIHFLWHKDIQ